MKLKIDLINLIDKIVEEKKYSNLELNYFFSNNIYNNKEKAFINNMLNLTLKNLIYIDYIIENLAKSPKRYIRQLLRISIAQILYTNSDNKGIIYEAVEIAKEYNEFQAKFVNSFLRNFIEKKESLYENASEDVRCSYPKWLFEKIKLQFGEENYTKVLKRYKEKSFFSVRVNHNKLPKEQFLEILKENNTEILYNILDIYYLSDNKILKSLEYLNGYISIQDASSRLVVYALDVKDGDMVYDVAAAPGGKSLAILDNYKPKKLIAGDIYEHKVKLLKEIEKKYNNFEAILADAKNFSEGEYDKILLDLPCSGIGVLTKKPEKIYALKLSDIKEIKKLQKKIFSNIYKLLKKGGELVYSTCTILNNENTNNIEYFLEKYNDLEVVDIEFPEEVKIIKDKFGGNLISYENKYLDGFYIIKLRKK